MPVLPSFDAAAAFAAALALAIALTPSAPARAGDEAPPLYEFAPLPEPAGWAELGDETELAIPRFLAPDLDRHAAARRRAERQGLVRPELAARATSHGLARPASATIERAVGWRLGSDSFSLTTSLVSGAGAWERSDTRFDWGLSHAANADAGLHWAIGTGGALGLSGSGEQRGSAMLGYRSQLFDKLTLSSEIAFATSYAFAADQAAMTLVPQVQFVADFSTVLAVPWTTELDIRIKREVPLAEGAYQTQASALLRLKYSLN